MPGVKDITSDLGKLREKKVLPSGEAPVLPGNWIPERKPAFNAFGWFFWVLIGSFLLFQLVFLAWIA